MDINHKLLLFTVALLISAECAMAARRCSDCGTNPVPYPLSTAAGCGDQSYKVRCEAGALRFDTLNSSYLITSLNPENQRFVIRPANLLPNTCVTSDLSSEGIQLNSSLPFNVTSSNTIMYLNCSDSLLRSPLNCSSSSLCHVYINGTGEVAACRDAPICCTFRAGGSTTSYSVRWGTPGVRLTGASWTWTGVCRLTGGQNRGWRSSGCHRRNRFVGRRVIATRERTRHVDPTRLCPESAGVSVNPGSSGTQ